MKDLDLLGPDADGSHLMLADEEGRRYRLPVTDALVLAARRASRRPTTPRRPGGSPGTMSPRDIQVQLRAGASIAEVVERSGADPSRIESYAAPVEAERAFIAQRARALRVGHLADAPDLGDLVVDRLASRQVPADEIVWDAVRRDGHPWEVLVTFPVDGRERTARWRVDLQRHVLTALDAESRWLSETDLGPGRTRPFPGAAEEGEDILDRLAATRGTRQEVAGSEEEFGDEADGNTPMSPVAWHEAPGAHPADSHPHEAPDAAVLTLAARQDRARAQRGPSPVAPSGPVAPSPADGATTREVVEATTREGVEDAVPAPDVAADAPPVVAAAASPEEPDPVEAAEVEAAPDPTEAGATDPATLDVPVSPVEAPRPRTKRRSTRRSVPSWDEIVFGTRAD